MKRNLALLATVATVATVACAPAGAPPVAPPAAVIAAPFPTVAPVPGPAPAVVLPAPVTRTLPNGLTVVYVTKPQLPLVHATLVARGGAADDPTRLPGLAQFTAEMLDEGAGARDALELATALDGLGATLRTGAGWDAAQVDLQVLRDRLPEALALMADVVVRPTFAAAEISRTREERLTELARARDEPRAIATNAYTATVYGAAHPYGRIATTESVRRVDRDALQQFHSRFYRPGSATLVLVGDVDPAVIHPAVEHVFGSWTAGAAAVPVLPPAPAPAATRIVLVDKPGAAQSEVRIGNVALARSNPDYFPLVVLNTLLGGSFTSRLNMNLRETHAYTYGARSSFDMRRGTGPFTASSAVVTAKTDSAVVEFFRELNRIRDEAVPQPELERAKSYVALGLPRSFETVGGVANELAELESYGQPLDFYDDYVQRVMAVTAADVQRVARRYVHPDRAVVVVVGDRATVEPGLRALGIGPVEVRPVDEFVR